MTTGHLILGTSIVLQFAAAGFAMRLALISARRSWYLLSVATILMGVRRLYSFAGSFATEGLIDVGAESIGLGISLAIFVGLAGLLRGEWRRTVSKTDAPSPVPLGPERFSRIAIGLGLITFLGTLGIGFYSYLVSRDAAFKQSARDSLEVAVSMADFTDLLAEELPATEVLRQLEQHWDHVEHRFEEASIRVLGRDGVYIMDSEGPVRVDEKSEDVLLLPLDGSEPIRLQAQLAAKKSTSAEFENAEGEAYLFGGAYSEGLDAMIRVDVPTAPIFAKLARDEIPWILGLAFIGGIFLPLSLGFMHRAYSVSLTSAHEAESDARKRESENKVILDTAADAIITIGETGSIASFNHSAERIFGYEEAEVLGKNIKMLMPEPTKSEHDGYLRKYIETGVTGMIGNSGREFQAKRKSGQLFPAEIVVGETWIGEKRLFAGSVRDLTERKRLEAQVRQSQKMEAIGTLAGGIAHDFNNILSAIIGFTDMTMSEVEPDSVAASYLEEVAVAGERARSLVTQILSFSRTGEQTKCPVDLSLIVNEAMKLLRATLPSTVELRRNVERQSGVVMAEPTQIHQVVMNLCTNAFQSMEGERGTLEVGLQSVQIDRDLAGAEPDLQVGPYTRLTVSDTGAGMEPPILDRIFDPFFTTKRVGEGSGLGLSTVYNIVRSHGGAIKVYSEPGVGTTFHVYFPQNEAEPEPAEDRDAPLPEGRGESILLVDDEKALVRMWSEILEGQGYAVTGYSDSREAVEAFHRGPDRFELLITDLTMPGLTGLDLIRELHMERPDLPILLMTGFSEKNSIDRARELGVSRLLMKPVTSRTLAIEVRRVLDACDVAEVSP